MRSFLGAVGYYRKFIPNFAAEATSLIKLLKKNSNFHWGPEEDLSFQTLKDRLITAPILSLPDYDKEFIIRTDASRKGIGGVLIQKDEDGNEHPLHFVSRTLKSAELNYNVTDLEGLAVFYCVKKFKHYICGGKPEPILITDHKPLVGFFKNTEPTSSRHAKWIIFLSSLKVKVKYEEGKKNVVADALSRLTMDPVIPNDKSILSTEIELINVDSEVKGTSESKKDSNFHNNINIQNFVNNKIIEINGTKYYKQGDSLRKIVVKPEEKLRLLESAHNIGHEGIFKTYCRLKRDYYWSNMSRDVKLYVKECHKCQTYKPQALNQYTEDIPTAPGLPFSRVGLDLIGPLPTTRRGNKYIIVLVDYLTKWVEAEPLQKTESEDVIRFLKGVFARHGTPEQLITDNGPQFCSDKTKAFLDLHDVFVRFITTYHPASNGEVENRNKEISKYLRILGNSEDDWDDVLPSALWALRTCKNEVTKFSSFELLYGRKDLQPFELGLNVGGINKNEDEEEYWIRKFINHHKWIEEAIKNIETANNLWMDRRRQMKRLRADFKPGDLILIKTFNRRKLDPYFIGPLKIVKRELNTVTVCDPISGEIAERNVHLKNIIPYFTEIGNL